MSQEGRGRTPAREQQSVHPLRHQRAVGIGEAGVHRADKELVCVDRAVFPGNCIRKFAGLWESAKVRTYVPSIRRVSRTPITAPTRSSVQFFRAGHLVFPQDRHKIRRDAQSSPAGCGQVGRVQPVRRELLMEPRAVIHAHHAGRGPMVERIPRGDVQAFLIRLFQHRLECRAIFPKPPEETRAVQPGERKSRA